MTVSVSYTHLRAHETVLDIVCRLLLEKKKNHGSQDQSHKAEPAYDYQVDDVTTDPRTEPYYT